MSNEPAVASGAVRGIKTFEAVCIHCTLPIEKNEEDGRKDWRHIGSGSIFCKKKRGMTLMEATPGETAKVTRTHNPSLQSPEAPICTSLEGEKAKCLATCDDTLDCCAPDCPCAAPESAVPAKVGPVSLTVTLNFDLGDPLQKELFCQCLEMFREAGLTQAVPALAASAPAQAEADAIKAQS